MQDGVIVEQTARRDLTGVKTLPNTYRDPLRRRFAYQ
jgi:hypothetical protein